ncbi:hypothetical protein HTZ84_05240 [Haloterrigena sp. SYSU A558-1]|uniref:Glucodextranase-like C-terminal domain-containing protein n=1 Tax=Haloterrigena gelatinilytica TaxID=2741724 RepID=A0ABX2LBK4_9EURY|nr:hypothetical protein [Haloterrigena gelatinilytica]NUC71718.1 hypothetical protein [Haloterrigena gelatinilytica]
MRGYPAGAGGLSASAGGLVDGVDRSFFDNFEEDRMAAYYERSTLGETTLVDDAGYHTARGLRLEGYNFLWTVPGSGFERYPDTDEWIIYVMTIDNWENVSQIWFPVFGDPSNEGDRDPSYEIQIINNDETFRIQSRDNSDNKEDVATDAESDQTYDWFSTGVTYAVGIYRKPSGGVLGGLWDANADYPLESEAIAYIDSADHPYDDGSSIDGIGPDDGPGRWGYRTGDNVTLRVHEVERVEPPEEN